MLEIIQSVRGGSDKNYANVSFALLVQLDMEIWSFFPHYISPSDFLDCGNVCQSDHEQLLLGFGYHFSELLLIYFKDFMTPLDSSTHKSDPSIWIFFPSSSSSSCLEARLCVVIRKFSSTQNFWVTFLWHVRKFHIFFETLETLKLLLESLKSLVFSCNVCESFNEYSSSLFSLPTHDDTSRKWKFHGKRRQFVTSTHVRWVKMAREKRIMMNFPFSLMYFSLTEDCYCRDVTRRHSQVWSWFCKAKEEWRARIMSPTHDKDHNLTLTKCYLNSESGFPLSRWTRVRKSDLKSCAGSCQKTSWNLINCLNII